MYILDHLEDYNYQIDNDHINADKMKKYFFLGRADDNLNFTYTH
jgi:hypothetical protein